MASPAPAEPVRLIVGLLHAPDAALDATRRALTAAFGPCAEEGGPWPFDVTDYYREEMGAGLQRRFWVADTLIAADALPAVKHDCAALERRAGADGRTVNLDPGLLDHHKLLLASYKPAGHKVYLGQGVWGDLTLRYHHGGWHPFEWTFPDLRDGRYDGFLTGVRRAYLTQRRAYLDAS